MYGCESWIIKKAEHWRIDAFELCCWKRLLIVLWAARSSNQSILKEINRGRTYIEAEVLILWLHGEKNRLTWKDLYAGKDWRQKEKGAAEDKMAK